MDKAPKSQARRVAHPQARTAAPATHAAGAAALHSPARDWRERARNYALLMRLDKPVGWLLLLWPTYWGLWAAAKGRPDWSLLVIFTLGVIVMRSAGCVINDYADRWLDAQVKRTAQRPLVNGKVAPREALAVFGALMLLALLLVALTNALTMQLAVVGAALAIAYPYLKRHTHLPQLWLGAAFGWSVPMAYAAQKGEVDQIAWLLFLGNVLWSTAYDTIYAMVDRDDDLKAGAKSTAILFDDLDTVAIGILHAGFLYAMWLAGSRLELGPAYTAGWCAALAIIAVQHWIIRTRARDDCFRAFKLSHWAGAALWVGMAVALSPRAA
ncbi:MAG: 4-hydroxybenzoate octaprenyltransferase [Xanthomonadales bacterium]|nr:4-hydroxybenzoate octaprenyltransferase [Xanthomonadales bacterium]